MYSEQTIQEVKSKADCVEVIGQFLDLKREGNNMVACCPFHNERSPSFKVEKKENFYKCFGCGKSGDAIQFLMDYDQTKFSYSGAIEWLANYYNVPLDEDQPKVYIKPTWKNQTGLPDKVVKWFESRKISQKTIEKLKITAGKEWMPQVKKEVGVIEFNYFRDGDLINIKYRDSHKNMKLFKDGELIFYNLDSVKGKDEVIITEGEADTAALIEAGLDANYGIISVPNGANLHGNNLVYVDNSIEHLSHVKKFHFATDNDIPGRKLREQLSERFGKEKCDYIIFKDCKDANDCLIRYGINGVIESIGEKIEFPLEGAFTIKDFNTEIDDMYANGLDRGVSIGLRDFSLRFVPGYLTTITGAPGSGKSEFVDEIVLRLLVRHQWTGAFYSPENKPTALHFSKIARRIIGKHWDEHPKITVEEKESVKNYLDRKVWFIKPEKDFSLDSILQAVANLKERHGIKWFVIDAWNKIEHKEGSDTDAVGRALEKLVVFCEAKQLHCFLVAHPRKVEKDKNTDKYKVVTMYDIAGSAHFYNKTDNGISVYRDQDTNITTIYIQKVKFNHWGWRNAINYKFDMPSGRYYYEGNYHGGSWIDKKPLFEQPIEKLPEGNITQRNDEPF